jgi:hypothetical protein
MPWQEMNFHGQITEILQNPNIKVANIFGLQLNAFNPIQTQSVTERYGQTLGTSSTYKKMEFYLCGHLKPLAYAASVNNEEALHHCIVDACQTIRNCSDIFERIWRSMLRRVEACTESHGEHCEHLLQMYSLSYNSQIKCFRAYVDMDMFFLFCSVELVSKVYPHLPVIPCIFTALSRPWKAESCSQPANKYPMVHRRAHGGLALDPILSHLHPFHIEQVASCVIASGLYTGSAWFESAIRYRLFWYFCGFPQKNVGIERKIHHERFKPGHLQFIISYSFCHSTLHNFCYPQGR